MFLFAAVAGAQTTAFNYQGRFTDSTVAQPTAGAYDFQFALYDAASGGTQQPQPTPVTISVAALQVVNGTFSTSLDFGVNAFAAGADRYLEIRVKKTTDAAYTTLTPRQQLTSSPYAVRTLRATTADALSSACAGCVTDDKIAAGISYGKLSGAPNSLPPSGSASGDLTGAYPAPTIAANAVTTAKIADGTITNSDISGTAAIDGTKINGSTITSLNGSNIASGTVADARLSANVTVQGNTFNAANRLLRLDASGKIPALDGSLLTNVNAAPGGLAVFSVSVGNTYSLASFGNSATRVFVGSLGGTSGSGATLTLTLPPANTYASGTVLRIAITDYITGAPSAQFQRTSTTSDLLHGFNQGSGSAGPGFPGALSSWVTDGASNWYKIQ